ncbi:MAG: nucleotidyltransferase domain-containing protein [Fusobacteriaceae bacterium]
MRFGLRDEDLEYIIKRINEFPEIESAYIFGSRAKGNYKKTSDIDIAIEGKEITFDTLSKLHSLLEETGPLPYMIDIVDLNKTTNNELREHIERVGIKFFSRRDYV